MNVVFYDCETTGLDPERNVIMEVAAAWWAPPYRRSLPGMMPTRTPGAIQGKYKCTVFLKGEDAAKMEPAVLKMHSSSGLLDKCIQPNSPTIDWVDHDFHWWLQRIAEATMASEIYLAGNSIAFDRRFMKVHMPKSDAMLHRRMLDISALHIMAGMTGLVSTRPKPEPAHRAMLDVESSIEQFEGYRLMLVPDFRRNAEPATPGAGTVVLPPVPPPVPVPARAEASAAAFLDGGPSEDTRVQCSRCGGVMEPPELPKHRCPLSVKRKPKRRRKAPLKRASNFDAYSRKPARKSG